MADLLDYFQNPKTKRQKQYEAVRSFVVDKLSAKEIAQKYGYKESSIYTLIKAAKGGRLELFPPVRMGSVGRRTDPEVQKKIVRLRNKNLSVVDIQSELAQEGIRLSFKTIDSILKDLGFEKLPRRTRQELGKNTGGKLQPQRSQILDFDSLPRFTVDTPTAGVYLFIPYILESGIIDIVKDFALPESSELSATNACLSMLLLKLIGCERLSQIGSYDMEPGLGVFAGVNVLPKPTYISTYSCLSSQEVIMEFQKKLLTHLQNKYPQFYNSEYINLDFHSIPHFGDESQMQKIWCGSRGKALKAANTIIAQDAQSNFILYTRSDILTSEQSDEIKNFIDYWMQIKGSLEQTLVFDCRFTTYSILGEIDTAGVRFITLRKRNQKLIDNALKIPNTEWKKIRIPIPKRKYQKVSVHEQQVTLSGCKNPMRQIIVKDHGRAKPTFIVTNDPDVSLQTTLEVYAKRWRIENKIAELVSFFNLNALSSPLMTRIHFDMLWTTIADTLYHVMAADLRRFENALAPTIFRKFINFPGKVSYNGKEFTIKIRKRSHTPIILGVEKLNQTFQVPWLENKKMKIIWTS